MQISPPGLTAEINFFATAPERVDKREKCHDIAHAKGLQNNKSFAPARLQQRGGPKKQTRQGKCDGDKLRQNSHPYIVLMSHFQR
jgi:hypothetical protein